MKFRMRVAVTFALSFVLVGGAWAQDLFQTLTGTVSPPGYVAADRWGYQTAEKVRVNFNTLNTYIKGGTGSPEGAVTGGVGSTYRRTDGACGTTFYVKESGSGNTGWRAVPCNNLANQFFTVTGPASSLKTFTFPNASATVLTDNALVTSAQGGTSNGFFAVSGPASSTKTFTFPNASAIVLTDNALVTVAQGGHGSAPASDDQVFVSSSTTAGAWKTVTDCNGANQALAYNQSSNAFSCTSITGGGGGGVGTVTNTGTLASGAIVKGNGGVDVSTTTTGTGVLTALGVNTGSAGAFVVNGGALGTPSSGTLTSATGLPISTGVSGLGTGVATFLGTPSGANLASALTTAVPESKGGTNQTTYTKGDLLASPGTTLNKLAVGSDGQVLTADAASTNGVKWAAAGGGGTAGALILLEEQTAAAASDVQLTTRTVSGQSGNLFQSDYDTYRIELVNLTAAAASDLRFAFSTDSGSNWIGGSAYINYASYAYSGGLGPLYAPSEATMRVRQSNSTSIAGSAWNGWLIVHDPLSTTLYKTLAGEIWLHDNSIGPLQLKYTGEFTTTATSVNAVRVQFHDGSAAKNITGTIRVYGIAK